MTAARLIRLYPRPWRDRYGDEFLAAVGNAPLRVQQVVDIVSGAIDAWLSSDVRRATVSTGSARKGGTMMSSVPFVCRESRVRYTTRDALIGSGVMLLLVAVLVALGIAARRNGLPVTGEMLKAVATPASLLLSMPLWLLKGQPWKAQATILGAALSLLVAASYVATLI
jgi:hypothetical protein